MLIELAVLFIITGLVVGTLSGLFGLGGGLTVVPVMTVFLELTNKVPQACVMHMAIATSLFVMIFTSLASTYSHHKIKNIKWSAALPLGIGVLMGAVIGAIVAHWIPSMGLRILFLAFLIYTIAKWVIKSYRKSNITINELETQSPKNMSSLIYGYITGFIAVILGIGCSVLAVPYLRHHKFSMSQSAAVASAITTGLALVGACTYITLGWHNTLLPKYSLGFVYMPAVLGLVFGSFFGAPLGTLISRKMPDMLQDRIYLGFLIMILLIMLF